MVTLIRLYPIFAACLAFVSFEYARNLRRKGKSYWLLPALICLIALVTIALWGIYRGDQNAEIWAKEWAGVTFSLSTLTV